MSGMQTVKNSRTSMVRQAVILGGVLLALGGSTLGTALADDWHHDEGRYEERHDDRARWERERAERERIEQERAEHEHWERERAERERWEQEHRYGAPAVVVAPEQRVIYAPPPVVVAPPAGLNIVLPIRIR